MKTLKFIIPFFIMLTGGGCISQFIPEINENKELIVVEGLITDQAECDTIKLYKSTPLGRKYKENPLSRCKVKITDDLGNSYDLSEVKPGTYITNPQDFCGAIGRKYVLKISTDGVTSNNYSYESKPMEMKPVPPIDTLYYEKILIAEADQLNSRKEGSQIYLNSHDPENLCKFYRWNFTEIWEIRLPYDVPNKICWVSKNSSEILIRNTGVLSENRISRLPVNYVSNESDRLNVKYCILVNQYSLNDDEYVYWEKLKNINQEVGSLYDITPVSIPNNIFCIEDPNESVLGYFSVSAKASRKLFIEDTFSGVAFLYGNCESEINYLGYPLVGLGIYYWIIIDGTTRRPPFVTLTYDKQCADCTTRGTNVKPAYWDDNH